MLPILPRILDQENNGTKGTPKGKSVTIYEDKPQEIPDVRTPLQNLNQQRRRSAVVPKPQYSQITPYDTPVGKTPKRKTGAPKPAQPKFLDNEGESKSEVTSGGASAGSVPMLNSLVYKQAVQLVKEKEEEKNKEIQSLHEFYKKCLNTIETNKQDAYTNTDGNSQTITPELVVGENFAFSDMSTLLIDEASGPGHVDSGCSPIRFDGGEEASQFNAVDMETWMTPIKTMDTSQLTSPVIQIDKAIETKVDSCEAETETDKIQTISRSAMTTSIVTREESVGTEHKEYSDMHTSVTPVKFANISTSYTPVKQMETETSMTPVHRRTITTQKTPVRSVAMETAMTPVHHVTMETAMTPVHHSTIETAMTPIQHTSGFTEMTPIKQVTMGTDMTPVKLHNECVGTSTIESHNVSVATIPVQVTDSQTSTSPVKTRELGIKTECISQCDVDVNTIPVKTSSVRTMVTPVKMRNIETSMSPIAVVHQGTGTVMPALKHASTQISTDHTDCVPSEYKQLYQHNRQLLREAEAQLEVYLTLKNQIDEANVLQEQLYAKVDKARNALRRKSEKIEKNRREWQKEHEEWEERMRENEEKMNRCVEERNQMALTYDAVVQGKQDAEEAHKLECDAHKKTLDELENVSTGMSELGVKYNKMKETYSTVEDRLKDLTQSRDENLVRSEAVAADLQLLQDKLQNEATRADTAEHQLQLLSERHEKEMLNLQRIIDSKTAETKTLEKRLRARLTSTVESKEFLEQENQVMKEDLYTAQSNVTQLLTQLTAAREEMANQMKESSELENQNQEISQELMVLQDELDHTKANAHLMLLDQNAEISQTIKTLETLSRLVNQLDADVEERLEHWSEISANSPAAENKPEEQASRAEKTKKKCHDRRSFVASIMDAINNSEAPVSQGSTSEPCTPTQEELEEGKQSPVAEESEKTKDSPTSVSGVMIGSSEGSAFQRVQSLSSNQTRSLAANETSHNATSDRGLGHSVESERASTGSDLSGLKPLFEHVNDVKQKSEAETKNSDKKHARAIRKHTEKITDLGLQIKELENINRELKENLSKNRDLMPQKAQEKCMKLEAELEKVYERLKSQAERNQILSDLLEGKIEECTDENQKKLIKQNVAFKKELQQWKSKFYKEQEQSESKITRLKQTAQQELETFYAAYENLKQIIMKHSAAVMLWPEREELEEIGAIAPGSPNLTK